MQRARKRHNVLDDEQNVDRLSALPDGVICHILSFMPTELSVKTSILAKRWRFLWAHVPILDLQGVKGSSQTTSFAVIICTLMLRHKAGSLNTFRLTYRDDDGPTGWGCYGLETCIATAIERNVQNLDLQLSIELPRCVLTCKTLVDLRMGGGVSIPSSGPIYLPSLKKLYIHSPLDCDVELSRLVSGCPVLEELNTLISKLGVCTLSLPTLKSLIISFDCFEFFDDEFYLIDDRLEINAPVLWYLKVEGYKCGRISFSPMNSLIEADISLTYGGIYVLELVDSICNVKCLKLSGDEDLYFTVKMPSSIVKFGSLTKLQLSVNCLQELIIYEGSWYSEDWMDPIEEPCACLLHSLRTVRIDGFECTEQGFDMVSYILRNARVLERMEIYCPHNMEKKFDAIQRISLFCRGSTECELAFS